MFRESVLGAILDIVLFCSWELRASLTISLDIFMAVWAAVLVLISGIIRIVRAVKMRIANEMMAIAGNVHFNWGLELVLGILIAVCSAVSICNPWLTFAAMGIIFGVNVVFYGVTMIISSLALY